MKEKQKIRSLFRLQVFTRDKYHCKCCGVCGKDRQGGEEYLKFHSIKDCIELDAHHIWPRKDMPNGGYVKENGISLCQECHIKAEDFYEYGQSWFHDGFHPEDLAELIGSTYDIAVGVSILSRNNLT